MISIRKLLTENEAEAPMLRVIQLLLQGIRLHTVDGNSDDLDRFREEMDAVSQRVAEEHDAHNLVVHAGAAIKALQDYNVRTAEFFGDQNKEMQAMVRMLTSAVGTIAKTGEQNIRELGEIEKRVVSATQIQDVRQIRAKLAECLDHIRQEAVRQQEHTDAAVEQLSRDMDRTRNQEAAAEQDSQPDEATGLPQRPAAESALSAACQSEKPTFAAVLSIDRIQIYNLRFGHKVGDEVMQHFTEWIRERLRTEDRLFRWSGSTLVALLPRPTRLEIVREEMGRIMEEQFEYTVQTASRGILLPISARWALFPMMAAPRLLFHKLDGFANFQNGND